MSVRDVGVSPRHSWQRVPLVSLLVWVVEVMLLLTLMVPPGVVRIVGIPDCLMPRARS